MFALYPDVFGISWDLLAWGFACSSEMVNGESIAVL